MSEQRTSELRFQDSQQEAEEYADDSVASYCPPAADVADANTIFDAVPEASRPDSSVKACKNIRVVFAHDLSGSMEGSRKQIANGTNEFVQDLQSRYELPCEFEAKFCLITFSGETTTVGEWTDIHDVPVFDAKSFVCHGSTPLWDACDVGLDKMSRECEECTAAFYAFTDGDDNNSKKANRSTIREKISKLNPALHTMLFIGSDPLSSAANADAIGVTRTKSLNPSSDNTPSAMRACTNTIARCVTGETQTPEFNCDDIIMSEGHSAHSVHSVVYDDDDNDDNVPTLRRTLGL